MNIPALKPQPALLAEALHQAARSAPESGIVEAMNYGREREGMIPLWAGEGDLPTPAFISEAATRSLAAGETFYTWQRGIPELREALARYHGRLYGTAFDVGRFSVTVGGMHAAQIAVRIAAGGSDEVLIPTPGLAEFPRRHHGRRGSAHAGADDKRTGRLDARPRPSR